VGAGGLPKSTPSDPANAMQSAVLPAVAKPVAQKQSVTSGLVSLKRSQVHERYLLQTQLL
jgi:hypothetical protein